MFHGDASRENVLEHLRIEAARVVVVAINDPTATRRITSTVHHLNPGACLIVRTRYIQEVKGLRRLRKQHGITVMAIRRGRPAASCGVMRKVPAVSVGRSRPGPRKQGGHHNSEDKKPQ